MNHRELAFFSSGARWAELLVRKGHKLKQAVLRSFFQILQSHTLPRKAVERFLDKGSSRPTLYPKKRSNRVRCKTSQDNPSLDRDQHRLVSQLG